MADPLTIATAITGFLVTAAQLKQYLDDVRNADKEKDRLRVELIGLNAYLVQLKSRVEKAEPGEPWFQGLLAHVEPNGKFKEDGIFAELQNLYNELSKQLPKVKPEHGLKKLFHRSPWSWSWDKVFVNEMMGRISRVIGIIKSILDEDHFTVSTVMQKKVNVIMERQERDIQQKEKDAIIEWLSPIRAHKRQEALISGAAPICQTFLGSDGFTLWRSGEDNWALNCYGMPGAGKTVMSAIVVRHLQQHSKDKNTPVIFMYLNHKEKDKQTLKNLLGSLLKQLIQYDENRPLSAKVKKIYHSSKKEARPDLNSLFEVLQSELWSFPKSFIVVDALDEAEEETGRELQERLGSLRSESVKLMTTQRPLENQVRSVEAKCDRCKTFTPKYYICNICDFALCLSCRTRNLTCNDSSHKLHVPDDKIDVEIRIPEAEMTEYVEWEIKKEFRNSNDTKKMGTFGRLCYRNPDLREEVVAVVVADADGLILQAKFHMDSLKSKLNVKQIKEALQNLPGALDDTYVKAMQRIDAQKPEEAAFARRVLSWLVYTQRPLSLAELQHALGVYESDKDFDFDAICDKETILSLTANLVIIDTDELAVRLVHLTAQEYFDRNREDCFPRSAIDITTKCLQYLSFESFKEPCGSAREDITVASRLEKYPFLRYASVYWGEHVQEVMSEATVVRGVLQFVSDAGRLTSTIQAAYYTYTASSVSWDVRKGVNGLHACAWFGLGVLVRELVYRGLDANSQDDRGQTALMYACRRGHADTVNTLLELGADVNIRSAPESTAMFDALAKKHTEVIKVLLECKDLDINAIQPHQASRTALMLASSAPEERQDIVGCILSREDINVNQRDLNGFTALSLAAERGYYEIAETLLSKRDTEGKMIVDINSVNKTGRSALTLAAHAGKDGIVELLLEYNADTGIRDLEGGGTAIMRAVDKGHTNIVTIMMINNVEIRVVDDLSRSLLHAASINGHADIVRLLVEPEDGLDPNLRDRNGRTPLHDTARAGKPEVTKVLLELGAKATLKDKFDRTPYTVARQHGERRVMLILEGKPDIANGILPADYDPMPSASTLPVWSLAKLGLISLIQSAISSNSLNFTERDPDSNDTALHTAISASHPEILSLLLLQTKIPIDAKNDYRRTPLHLAALYGSLPCASVLVKHGADLDVEDKWSTTPMLAAQQEGHLDIAVALIGAGCATDSPNTQVQVLFFRAVELANVKAVDVLIKKGADVLEKNLDGLSALQFTKEALAEADRAAGQGEGEDEHSDDENGVAREEIDKRQRLREVLQLLQTNKSFYRPLRTNSERSEESSSVRSTPRSTPLTSPQPELERNQNEFAFRPRPPVV